MEQSKLLEAIARAKEKVAAAKAAETPSFGAQKIREAEAAQQQKVSGHGWVWNKEQAAAIDFADSGKSFCLIGAAGTGKTTTLRGALQRTLENSRIPPLEKSTKHLRQGTPGVVLVSFTRRAVRNIAKQMPDELKSHCLTIHKLLEYAPEKFWVTDPKTGEERESTRFAPQRTRANPLPSNLRLIVVDESSMVSTDLYKLVVQALPYFANVQWIFLGDLNQLPPIYGDAILGTKLLELPIVELVEVYRQALESPIIELALQIKDNKIPSELKALTKDWVKETPRGKVTLVPWKKKLDMEDALLAMINDHAVPEKQGWIRRKVREGFFNFEEDVILCPWNKVGLFGTIELNKAIGTELARMRGADVFEVIAGYSQHYFSVGDRVMVDKRDAIIQKISRNVRYIGKFPKPHSPHMDYWGWMKNGAVAQTETLSNEDIEKLLDGFADSSVEDRVNEASHALTVRFVDDFDEEMILSKSAEINATELAYAMSVHKSQGSEWRRVFVFTHDCHVKMLSRELVYTAFTRASQELYVIMPPMMLSRSAARPRIKGDTLKEKLRYFQGKANERQDKLESDDEGDE